MSPLYAGVLVGAGSVVFLLLLGLLVSRKAPQLRRATSVQGWVVECPGCKVKTPAGDAGVIRVGAAGTKRSLMICPACKQRRWLRLRKG